MKKVVLLTLFCFLLLPAFVQKGYAVGDVAQNFNLKKVLNHTQPTATFNSIKNKITIVDFFGTWCVPCIRALPQLAQLQQQYPNDVKVLLISNEGEEKLKKFIAARNGFLFPVAVDEDNAVTNLFMPPAYPYTVVLNENGKVLAITEAAAINDATIKSWLSGTINAAPTTAQQTTNTNTKVSTNNKKNDNSTVQLAQDFVYAAKTGDDLTGFMQRLNNLSETTLDTALKNDDAKKAFWINVYNGYTNAVLKKNGELYKDRGTFFKKKQIIVAGKNLSLDDIEHGLLRRSKTKWSLGYISKLFPGSFEKKHRVDKVDYRIHFALNCGAKSCPPIAFYTPEKLETQLELATKNYLTSEATYDAAKNEVALPAIMSWFRADFGGKQGIRKVVKQYGIVPQTADKVAIDFKPYDWTLYLNNFRTE